MRCWLLRYTLVGQQGNGYAIVIAKDAKTAQGVLTRQGRIADAGYKVYSIESFDAIQITKCFDSNIIVAEGLVSTGEDGVGIDNITYNDDTGILTFILTNGKKQSFDVRADMEPLNYNDIISAMDWDGN